MTVWLSTRGFQNANYVLMQQMNRREQNETITFITKKNILLALVLPVFLVQSLVFAEDPPAKATEPVPSNGSIEVRTNHNLFWTAGSGATSHDVYFGTSSPPAFAANVTDPNYESGALQYNTVYYWRIDEVNSGGTTTGDEWSFTTRAAPMDMEGFHFRGGMFLRLSGQGEVDCPEAYRVLKQMKRLGCTWMCLLINEMQEDADTIAPSYTQWTHYPSEIEAVVTEAKSLGLKTMIRLSKPQYYENALSADKEELLDPEGWFATYADYANRYAEIAEDVGVDIFCAGSELHDTFLQGYDSEWTSIINGVRARYNGPVYFTMAGNGFLKNGNSIPFWDELDYIGINAYFQLSFIDTQTCVMDAGSPGTYNPTPQELMDQYECAMNTIQDFRISANLTDKPVIFGEGGYRSTDGCNMKIDDPPIDMQEQVDCVNAMMTKAPERDWFKGMNFWQFSTWDDEGGQININHGVRGKKAQDTFVHNYMAIDHFENYGHSESAAVSDNWLLVNGTATMSLESTEVHGGDNSMKVSYDTTSTYCKIQRSLGELSDWSGDYSHITLWFKGDTNRAGDDLTLKIVGPDGLIGEAVYTGGSGIADWTRWEIDLNSDITGGTGDLSAVKCIRFQLPGGGGGPGTLYLDEIIRLPVKAIPINPFNNATNVCPNKDLFYRSGYEAQSHNVYFGFSSTAVDNATTDSDEFLGNTTFPSFRLTCIDSGKTCYWRVDEIGADESVTKGDVWSFTTRDYTLGDFEDEETGDVIQVQRRWKHITGTMTNTVVESESHTGSKSLEMVYDNSSEDCTIRRGHHNDYRPWNEETTSVGIWVKGNASNSGDIAIQIIHQDETIVAQKTFPNATQNTDWTWLAITETDFTPADLFGMRYLAIVIPQASGSGGTIYLDDVRRITGKPAMPTPGNGATGVDVEADLHWQRATDADSHDVYFGTDQTAVGNATTSSSEYMGNITSSNFHLKYPLDTLNDNTTYYWRVDRIKGAATTKGDVWSFSTGGSSGPPQQAEFNPTDDSFCKQNSATSNYGTNEKLAVRNESTGAGLRSFLKFNVSGIGETITEATLKLYSATVAANVTAHAVADTSWSENTVTWENMPDLGIALDTLAVSPDAWYSFDVTDNVTGNGEVSFGLDTDYTGGDWYHFNSKEASNIPVLLVTYTSGEPEPPGQASNPSPADSATDISIDSDLTWTAGSGSTSHDVYFGTSSPGAFQGNQTATTFDPDTMSNDTTYYWRIDEVNGEGTTTGVVWSFTTETAAPPPGQANNPSPADSATDISIDADLSWTAGSGATSHDVYFGTSSPGTFQGNQTAVTFEPGTMSNDTTYYWRIDEVNASGTTTGAVWSFTTESVPLALPWSDDFETGDFSKGWTTQNGNATVSSKAEYEGIYGAKLAGTTWMEKAVDTTGFTGIHVKYYRMTYAFDSGEYLYVEYHDGSQWNELEATGATDWGSQQDKLCGSGADNNSSFKIRFRTNADKTNECAYVDLVEVTGTAQ